WRQRAHPALLTLESLEIGIVCAWLQSCYITILNSSRILAQSKARQLALAPAESAAAVAGGVVKQSLRAAGSIAQRLIAIDLLREARSRTGISIVGVHAFSGTRSKRRHLSNRNDDTAPGLQEWWPQIVMIEHLHLGRLGAEVFHDVVN